MLVSSHISHSHQGLTTTQTDHGWHDQKSSGYNTLDSSYSSHGSTSTQMKKSATKAADQVKKSFTSAFSNISGLTDKIKAKIDQGDDLNVPDDFDTASVKTDTSDDDIDFEILALEDGELPAFGHQAHQISDTASSTDTDMQEQDDMSSIYAESSTATKGRELV